LEVAKPVVQAGLEFQRQHVALLERGLGNVERYARDIFQHFRRFICLAALKPRAWGGYDDFSHPELPGSFLASVIDHPLEMADHLIHEFQHNRLSLIEESGPLFDSDYGDAEADARFFSPWRDKPRALYGVFHGVYVFIAVLRYWLAVYRANDTSSSDRRYVIDRRASSHWRPECSSGTPI
jgi:HEXXH motif-containing protein